MSSTRPALTTCKHCGTPYRPPGDDDGFCCRGCAYVFQLLHQGGMERFYELKGSGAVPPVGSRAFQEVESESLVQAVREAEEQSTGNTAQASFSLRGISCLGCVWLIEAIYREQPGALKARIDARIGGVDLMWQKAAFDCTAFARALQRVGYTLGQASDHADENIFPETLTRRLRACAFFLLNTMLFTLPGYLGMAQGFFLEPLFQLLAAFFATLSLIVGGGYFMTRAWEGLRRGVLHIDLPIALGLIAAYLGSLLGWMTGYLSLIYFDFVATFTFLMLVGRWLQEAALAKNRALLEKRSRTPSRVIASGGPHHGQAIPLSQLQAQSTYTLAPGEINPVAAEATTGQALVSLEWINGESEPVTWPAHRALPAGAINVGLAPITLRACEAWAESLLARLLERPEDTFRHHRLQTVLRRYTGIVLLIAAFGTLGWLLLADDPLKAAQVGISVLIVSCPCALGVALPMANELAIARLRRAGLFIKSTDIWERMRQVRAVVFDKTGTLTLEAPRLTNPESLDALDTEAREALHTLVDTNRHPIARGLREALLACNPALADRPRSAKDLHETLGQGVYYEDTQGKHWSLGQPDWQPTPSPSDTTPPPPDTRSVLRRNGQPLAAFRFIEDIRDDARETFDYLRHKQLHTAILSGDSPKRITQTAQALGLPASAALGSLSPEEKAAWIDRHAPGQALMIGDGANDSLAFDRAICRGTPVVDRSILESSSDFFFFGRSLRALPLLFQTVATRRQTVSLLFALSVTYNAGAVLLSLAGLMHPLLAAIIMPMSSLVTLAIAWLALAPRQ